jgi:hypothetical protein
VNGKDYDGDGDADEVYLDDQKKDQNLGDSEKLQGYE